MIDAHRITEKEAATIYRLVHKEALWREGERIMAVSARDLGSAQKHALAVNELSALALKFRGIGGVYVEEPKR